MGYFFSMTWMWWLLAIVLAVAITWAIFRERKHKDKLNDNRARGERGLAGGGEAKLDDKAAKREAKLERKEERAGAHAGNQFDAGYEGASLPAEGNRRGFGADAGRIEGDAGRLEGDRGQFRSDEERARLAAEADRTRVDGVQIPGQHASLKERAQELKEKAEARTGRRKFF